VVYCYSNGVVLPNLFSSNAITQSTQPHSFFFLSGNNLPKVRSQEHADNSRYMFV
jgi:hypothetical protein